MDTPKINVCACEGCRTTIGRDRLFCEVHYGKLSTKTCRELANLMTKVDVMDRSWQGTGIFQARERARVELARQELRELAKG